ncbi:hypothetical protein [Mycoplasmopsis gallopavonis]|uniref:Uncharacterized protein n=1 Tax=Mycoplasmopsis gallopavonis TaxID=76629 RepID=A0A449B005_9BACT|nr:hypothetical protein [Mycoplasmopsis gallopavonis]RIV16534.1 hypothetical protein D1113_01960 [Mycoplasmopsis gallopavonis]VEU73072.1 Uncharacterised protein [Mycoplasmopsis gallopavonis]
MSSRVKKIKLNQIDNKLWYYPSIWTLSIRKWASRPYRGIEDFLVSTDFIYQPLWIDINKDPDFRMFNSFQKVLKTNIELSNPKPDQDEFVFPILDKVKLVIPVAMLEKIKSGKFFSWPLIDFQRLVQTQLNTLKENQEIKISYIDNYEFDIQIIDLNA